MKSLLYVLSFLGINFSFSQQILKGKVLNVSDVEGIHVFNKTLQKYSITNANGIFEISAKINDTIVFSAVQYELKSHIVRLEDFISPLEFLMKEKVNELDEVFIRPELSGNLLVDTKNIKTAQPVVTSKSLQLPNADVEPLIIEERRLYTANSTLIDGLINAISGRTKKLKKQLANYKKGLLEEDVYNEFKDFIAHDYGISKDKVYDFIFYVSNDPLFTSIVKTKDPELVLEFLKTKSVSYKKL